MSHLVLARKYRPAAFNSVAGQEHVTRTLMHSIERNKIAHAILLTGPRGVGKTSIARIISKCLNCEKGPTTTPCLKCSNCKDIAQGISIAVREIDGASNNSVDNVRELIDSFRSLPAPGSKYKVYIIDEVHMLSTSAFNALLKSLEEPPPHTVFILATTEVHKIPETVISRCQRHDLRSLPLALIHDRLSFICKEEGVIAEDGVLALITRLSEGSMRDAQTLLERVQAFCEEGRITLAETTQLFGLVEKIALFKLSETIFKRDPKTTLTMLDSIFETGVDVGTFAKDFVTHFRELLFAKIGGEKALQDAGTLEGDLVEMIRQAEGQSLHDLQDLVYIVREGADAALRSSFPKYALEALVVRMATRIPVTDMDRLLQDIQRNPQPRTAASTPAAEKVSSALPEKKDLPKKSDHKAANPVSNDTSFDWPAFVRFAQEKGSRMIGEHLKRLQPISYKNLNVELKGPEFSVSYLTNKEMLNKLQTLLREFTGSEWKMRIEVGESVSTPEPGSLRHTEQLVKKQTQEEKKQQILSHPNVQDLQKIFPGSTIEAIRIKE